MRLHRMTRLIAIMMVLLLAIAGCGRSPADDTVEDPDPVEQPGDDPTDTGDEPGEEDAPSLVLDNWLNPADMSSLVDRFQELSWTWAAIDSVQGEESVTVHYRLSGQEQVGGQDALRADLEVDGDTWSLWVNEAGAVIQTEVEGEIMAGEMASFMFQTMTMVLFWPFAMLDQFDMTEALVGDDPGLTTNLLGTTRERMGDREIDVHRLEVSIGPPHTSDGEVATVAWAIGDFGDFQMLIEWGVSGETSDSDHQFTMQVDTVIPR